MASGLPVFQNLTDQEAVFVRKIAIGESPAAAAQAASFPPEEAWRMMRRPRVAAAIHQEVQRAIIEDAPISMRVLKTLRDDKNTPARTRADIGLKLMAMAGHGVTERKADDSKQLSEMSSSELLAFVERNQAEIDRLEAELAARAKEVSAPIAHQLVAKPLNYLE